jgi:hypothetical protein
MFKDFAFSQRTLLIVIDDYVPNRFLSCHVFHPRKATSPAYTNFRTGRKRMVSCSTV